MTEQTKKQYLVDEFTARAKLVADEFKFSTPAQRSEMMIGLIAVCQLCGQDELLEPTTPESAERKLTEIMDSVVSRFQGEWNEGQPSAPEPHNFD
jgi:hypothetical protein